MAMGDSAGKSMKFNKDRANTNANVNVSWAPRTNRDGSVGERKFNDTVNLDLEKGMSGKSSPKNPLSAPKINFDAAPGPLTN